MAGFSNYSTNLVHLMAPGFNVRSTFPMSGSVCSSNPTENDGYCLMDGTSMATPFVTGTAALLFSYRPKATVAQVRAAILAGVTAGGYLTTTGGRLNAKAALNALGAVVAP
jgi:subtilisin family serine protease